MTTVHTRKYEFGHSFIDEEGHTILPEVEAAKKNGYKSGYQKGYEQAKSEIEIEIASTLQKVTSHLSELINQQAEAYKYITSSTLLLVQHISKRLFPEMLNEKAEEEVTQFAMEILKCIDIQTHMTFFVHPDLLEGVKSRLKDIPLKNENFDLKIESDKELNRSDCKLIWEDGGVEKFPSRIINEIDHLLEGAIKNFPIPEKEIPVEQKEEQEQEQEKEKEKEKEEEGEGND